jgi:membrane protein CcdC involved in cytochrome C biogenesis
MEGNKRLMKTITSEDGNWIYSKFNLYEKYIKMNIGQRQTFLKFSLISIATIISIVITLIVNFEQFSQMFILIGLGVWIGLILIYLFCFKEPNAGVIIGFVEFP